MEGSFKTNPQQWLSVVTDKFRMSTNGGKEYTAQEVVDRGTYNLFLENSDYYRASDETFKSSYNLFHTAFPDGFHWELYQIRVTYPLYDGQQNPATTSTLTSYVMADGMWVWLTLLARC